MACLWSWLLPRGLSAIIPDPTSNWIDHDGLITGVKLPTRPCIGQRWSTRWYSKTARAIQPAIVWQFSSAISSLAKNTIARGRNAVAQFLTLLGGDGAILPIFCDGHRLWVLGTLFNCDEDVVCYGDELTGSWHVYTLIAALSLRLFILVFSSSVCHWRSCWTF